MQKNYKLNEYNDVYIELPSITTPIYFMGDIHIDSVHCNTKLFKTHLEQAKANDGLICIIGDLFDIMQTRNDPRGRKGEILTQLVKDGYLNETVRLAVETLEPYKDNILLIGYGNHEMTILKRLEFDIIKEVCERLNVIRGGYEGFIACSINPFNSTNGRFVKKIFYTHGKGINPEMTMGVLGHKRMDIWVRNVDIIISGHLHSHFIYEQPVVELTAKNTRIFKSVYHVQIPTYKDREKIYGYGVEKLHQPAPKGCIKVSFTATGNFSHNDIITRIERIF